jgi:hypothetical protein
MTRMRLFTIIAASLTLALNGFADGTVLFQNSLISAIKIYNFVTLTTAPATPADDLVVGLFWGTTPGTATSLVATTSIITLPDGNSGIIAATIGLPIPGTNPGDTGYFQVAAWYASYGATAAGMNACIAAGAYWGASGSTAYGVFGPATAITLGSPPPYPGTPIFGPPNETGLLHGFTITGTPELGTITMASFGAFVLFVFRRRK